MQKQRISDETFKKLLFKECSKGTPGADLKTNFFEILRTTYSIHKSRALQLHDIYYPEWAKLNSKHIEQGVARDAEKAAKMGLKTKTERVMILQNEVDKCLGELQDGKTSFTVYHEGVAKKIQRPMTVSEIALLRRTLRELQSEISKIEGDYAAAKTDVTTNGKSIASSFQIEVIDRRESVSDGQN